MLTYNKRIIEEEYRGWESTLEDPIAIYFMKWVRIKAKILELQLPEEEFAPNQALLSEVFDSDNFPFFLSLVAKIFKPLSLNAQDLSYLFLSFQGDERKTFEIIHELWGSEKELLFQVINRHSVNFRSKKVMNFVNSQMDYWKSNSDKKDVREEAKRYIDEVNVLKLELDALLES